MEKSENMFQRTFALRTDMPPNRHSFHIIVSRPTNTIYCTSRLLVWAEFEDKSIHEGSAQILRGCTVQSNKLLL